MYPEKFKSKSETVKGKEEFLYWLQTQFAPTIIVEGTEIAKRQIAAITRLTLADLLQPFGGIEPFKVHEEEQTHKNSKSNQNFPLEHYVKNSSLLEKTLDENTLTQSLNNELLNNRNLLLKLAKPRSQGRFRNGNYPEFVYGEPQEFFTRFVNLDQTLSFSEDDYLTTLSDVIKACDPIMLGDNNKPATINYSKTTLKHSLATYSPHIYTQEANIQNKYSIPIHFPWFRNWYETVYEASRWNFHEALQNPIALVLVVTSLDENPVSSLNELLNSNLLPPSVKKSVQDQQLPVAILFVNSEAPKKQDVVNLKRNGPLGIDNKDFTIFNSICDGFPNFRCFDLPINLNEDSSPHSSIFQEIFYQNLSIQIHSKLSAGLLPMSSNVTEDKNNLKIVELILSDEPILICSRKSRKNSLLTKQFHLFKPHDLVSLKNFIHKFISEEAFPQLYNEISKLENLTSHIRKGLKNQFKYFWRRPRVGAAATAVNVAEKAGEAAEAFFSAVGSVFSLDQEPYDIYDDNLVLDDKDTRGTSESFRFSSIEWQGRILADYYFLTRDYERAALGYRSCIAEFKHAKDTLQLASAYEMCGICFCIIGENLKEAISCLESAFKIYLKVKNIRLASRSFLLNLMSTLYLSSSAPIRNDQFLKIFESYSDLATILDKKNTLNTNYYHLNCAILLEQLAHLQTSPSKLKLSRRQLYYLAMAGQHYNRIELRNFSMRCYSYIIKSYAPLSWSQIPIHFYFTLTRQAYLLNDLSQSIFFFETLFNFLSFNYETAFLSNGCQPLTLPLPGLNSLHHEREAVYLKEFIHIYKSWKKTAPTMLLENPLTENIFLDDEISEKCLSSLSLELRLPILFQRNSLGQFCHKIKVYLEIDDMICQTFNLNENVPHISPQIDFNLKSKRSQENAELHFNENLPEFPGMARVLCNNKILSDESSLELRWQSYLLDQSLEKLITSNFTYPIPIIASLKHSSAKQSPQKIFEQLERTVSLHSPVKIEVTLVNPLLIRLDCQNLKLFGTLEKENPDCKIQKMHGIECFAQNVTLEPREVTHVQLEAIPVMDGKMKLKGVQWDLSSIVRITQYFCNSGTKRRSSSNNLRYTFETLFPYSHLSYTPLPNSLTPSQSNLARNTNPLNSLPIYQALRTNDHLYLPTQEPFEAPIWESRAITANSYYEDLRLSFRVSSSLPRVKIYSENWPSIPSHSTEKHIIEKEIFDHDFQNFTTTTSSIPVKTSEKLTGSLSHLFLEEETSCSIALLNASNVPVNDFQFTYFPRSIITVVGISPLLPPSEKQPDPTNLPCDLRFSQTGYSNLINHFHFDHIDNSTSLSEKITENWDPYTDKFTSLNTSKEFHNKNFETSDIPNNMGLVKLGTSITSFFPILAAAGLRVHLRLKAEYADLYRLRFCFKVVGSNQIDRWIAVEKPLLVERGINFLLNPVHTKSNLTSKLWSCLIENTSKSHFSINRLFGFNLYNNGIKQMVNLNPIPELTSLTLPLILKPSESLQLICQADSNFNTSMDFTRILLEWNLGSDMYPIRHGILSQKTIQPKNEFSTFMPLEIRFKLQNNTIYSNGTDPTLVTLQVIFKNHSVSTIVNGFFKANWNSPDAIILESPQKVNIKFPASASDNDNIDPQNTIQRFNLASQEITSSLSLTSPYDSKSVYATFESPFTWIGITEGYLPILQTGESTQINFVALIYSPGLYNLNTFTFEVLFKDGTRHHINPSQHVELLVLRT